MRRVTLIRNRDSRLRQTSVVLGAIICSTLSAPVFAEQYRFAFFALPPLGGNDSFGYGIGPNGEVVGSAYLATGGYHAAMWVNGKTIDLGTLGGSNSHASDINSSQWVVGRSVVPGGGSFDRHAFLWRDDSMSDLGTLGGDRAEAEEINEPGQIVGFSRVYLEDTKRRAFIWDDGIMTDLGALEIDGWSEAWGLNNLGQVVGNSYSETFEEWRAVLWDNGRILDLGTLNGANDGRSNASGINDLGVIIGTSDLDFPYGRFAFMWIDGVMYNLGVPEPMDESSARSVNNLGQVVGTASWYQFDPSVGFLWEEENGMQRLDDLLPPRCRWRTDFAWDINDAGQISGTGYLAAQPETDTAFLMSPVYPTMTVSQPLPGLAGEVNTLTLSNCTPGTRVYLTYATRGGGTIIPGCDIQENALQLENPKVAGSVIADANGEGVFTFFVPDAARNLGDILIQAVVPGECAVSNLVVEGFE